MDFLHTDIEKLHEQLVNKEITSVDLVKETLANIEQTDAKYDAFLATMSEKALAEAATIDEAGIDPDNVLCGIAYGIKDNLITKDMTTTAGSKIIQDFKQIYDATVDSSLREHRADGLCKLNM